jgi:hypothetical protein
MTENAETYAELNRIADYTAELQAVRRCGDDERIDRAFMAACKRIWGFTLEDFDDDSLSPKDHAFLDRMTWKRACAFARQNGYDLIDPVTGDIVTEWWGFVWMILAEKRGLLTPEGRTAAWNRYYARLMARPSVAGVIRSVV